MTRDEGDGDRDGGVPGLPFRVGGEPLCFRAKVKKCLPFLLLSCNGVRMKIKVGGR